MKEIKFEKSRDPVILTQSNIVYNLLQLYRKQGWKFAHLISERIARFLSKNEQMSDSLKK